MARFEKEFNFDPNEVKGMSVEQKQDCIAEIDRRRDYAWKYSVGFCLLVMLFMLIYSIISTVYTLRFHGLLESVSVVMFVTPIFVFVPSFFAHFMNGKCVMWAFFAYAITGLAVIFTGSAVNAWAAPFAFVGAVMYARLSRCCDIYQALSKEEGFPEFFNIEECVPEAKAVIERNEKKEEAPLNFLTQAAIIAAQKDDKGAGDSENQG